MKYTILGFQQTKLIELGLDTADALLLRTLKDLYSSMKMEYIIHENKRYVWINQNYLFQQIPIIGTIKTLRRKIDKLKNLGLLDGYFSYNKNGQKGSFSYYLLTEKVDELSDYDSKGLDKMTKGVGQNDQRGWTNSPYKDTSIRDTSIRDKEYICQAEPDKQIPYKKIIDYLNEKTGKNYKHTSNTNKKLIKARYNEGYTLEDFYKVIDIKVSQWLQDPKMEQYLRPQTLFSGKFDTYLNEGVKNDGVYKGNKEDNGYKPVGIYI